MALIMKVKEGLRHEEKGYNFSKDNGNVSLHMDSF